MRQRVRGTWARDSNVGVNRKLSRKVGIIRGLYSDVHCACFILRGFLLLQRTRSVFLCASVRQRPGGIIFCRRTQVDKLEEFENMKADGVILDCCEQFSLINNKYLFTLKREPINYLTKIKYRPGTSNYKASYYK